MSSRNSVYVEKPFSPFNDYLGLSEVLKQVPDKHVASSYLSPSEMAYIDQRIDEIVENFFLQKQRELEEKSTCDGQWKSQLMMAQRNESIPSTPTSIRASILSHTPERTSWPIVESPRPSLTNINSVSNSPVSPHDVTTPTRLPWFVSSKPLKNNSAELISNDGIGSSILKDTQLGTSQLVRKKSGCSFCRNNKEVDEWVTGHQLKDSLNRVTCPVLRNYQCPLCYAMGDHAHTIGHCPLNPDKKKTSLPLAVRRRTNATGKLKL